MSQIPHGMVSGTRYLYSCRLFVGEMVAAYPKVDAYESKLLSAERIKTERTMQIKGASKLLIVLVDRVKIGII